LQDGTCDDVVLDACCAISHNIILLVVKVKQCVLVLIPELSCLLGIG